MLLCLRLNFMTLNIFLHALDFASPLTKLLGPPLNASILYLKSSPSKLLKSVGLIAHNHFTNFKLNMAGRSVLSSSTGFAGIRAAVLYNQTGAFYGGAISVGIGPTQFDQTPLPIELKKIKANYVYLLAIISIRIEIDSITFLIFFAAGFIQVTAVSHHHLRPYTTDIRRISSMHPFVYLGFWYICYGPCRSSHSRICSY